LSGLVIRISGSMMGMSAEAILLKELTTRLDALPEGRKLMIKLTIPDVPDLYSTVVKHLRVARVLALSGGYHRAEACQRLAANHGVIASFSRALTEDLRHSMSDARLQRDAHNRHRRDIPAEISRLPASTYRPFPTLR
jgi:fructose-bisphosphate aldolase class 1